MIRIPKPAAVVKADPARAPPVWRVVDRIASCISSKRDRSSSNRRAMWINPGSIGGRVQLLAQVVTGEVFELFRLLVQAAGLQARMRDEILLPQAMGSHQIPGFASAGFGPLKTSVEALEQLTHLQPRQNDPQRHGVRKQDGAKLCQVEPGRKLPLLGTVQQTKDVFCEDSSGHGSPPKKLDQHAVPRRQQDR